MSNEKKKCTMCNGTGQIITGSKMMAGLTGNKNSCPTCMGQGYTYH